jgi:hypothetical protein
MLVKPWPYANRPMTLDTLRDMYDSSSFRVSERRYPPGAEFDGRTRDVTWFVLEGACRLKACQELTIRAGDVAEIGAGDFTLLVLGDVELHLVQVWDLRPHMN